MDFEGNPLKISRGTHESIPKGIFAEITEGIPRKIADAILVIISEENSRDK